MFVGVALISVFLVAQTRACFCPQVANELPVCCDGNQQYGSACTAACDSATNCVVGLCPTDSCICTREYDPQCCDDGNTYSNPCVANCASATNCVSGECPTVGCDGICTSYYDGCNNCMCGDNGEAGCTKMACLTQGTPECLECAAGYTLNQDTKECEVAQGCGGIPFCQSFQEDYCNACGCPNPETDPNTAYCTKMSCQLREENVCTACMEGYVLNNDGAECVKPAPTPEPCMCAQIYDPVCCGGQQYGNLCSAGCAGETAACEDGECAASRTSCTDNTQCQDPYQCYPNPECQGTALECADDKVCLQVDGRCWTPDEPDCQAGFECLQRRRPNRYFCIQFQ